MNFSHRQGRQQAAERGLDGVGDGDERHAAAKPAEEPERDDHGKPTARWGWQAGQHGPARDVPRGADGEGAGAGWG